jgi:hypothetical protein
MSKICIHTFIKLINNLINYDNLTLCYNLVCVKIKVYCVKN